MTDKDKERSRISPAMEAVATELRARAEKAKAETRAVLEATSFMAVDPAMLDLATTAVVERNLSAARAIFEAANTFRDMLAAAGGYIGARVADIEDVRDRIVAAVLGVPMPGIPDPGHPFILVARDLAPADTATVDPEKVLGFVTTEGGPTSHTAILARTLGVPAVVAATGALSWPRAPLSCSTAARARSTSSPPTPRSRTPRSAWPRAAAPSGCGGGGRHLRRAADPAAREHRRPEERQGRRGGGRRGRGPVPHRVPLPRLRQGADGRRAGGGLRRGVRGLPRGKKVVVRTLDAGADKPLAFLDQGEEPNPALGVRGVRVAFEDSGILDRQLQAVARAAERSSTDVWVMAPMIALASEAEWFSAKVREHGLKTPG